MTSKIHYRNTFRLVLALALLTTFASSPTWGQAWNGSNPTGVAWRDGNVAIGASSSGKKLRIHTGNTLGVGDGIWMTRDNPAGVHALGILSNLANGAWGPMTKAGDFMFLLRGPANGDPQSGLVIAPWNSQASGLRIAPNGNVGIGTPEPGAFRLAVNGQVRAKEIIVESNWADFVFEDDYQLPSLEEVENHIESHGHLPNIPSAQEVEANGIGVGEMQSKLLQKIEELTLYMIDLKKENVELRSQVEMLVESK